jgi:hypothetical protein
MTYHFSKYKFAADFFYKKIELATVKVFSDCFYVQVYPYFSYSGKYYIHSIYSEDSEKIIYRTMYRNMNEEAIDLDYINSYNEFFIGIYKSGRKVTIFQQSLIGIIFKT